METPAGKAKTLRPHRERTLRARRLSASPRKAKCISEAEITTHNFYSLIPKLDKA